VRLAPAPPAASAAQVTIRMQQLTYTGGGVEANNLTIAVSGPDYTLSDSGAAISSPADCVPRPRPATRQPVPRAASSG
jgi:hypothetical protein